MYGSGRMVGIGGGVSVGGKKTEVKRKYPHDMFKNGVKKVAKTKAEHDALEKLGYTHKK